VRDEDPMLQASGVVVLIVSRSRSGSA
jgi:hypothetical protein